MSRPKDSRFPYMPGIDAMRALAVLAVFGYHAGLGWIPGGFLGVDVFFVISGYLITSLLLREFRARRPRRARPLLAAAGASPAAGGRRADRGGDGRRARSSSPTGSTRLRGDALTSLFYFANWHFIFADVSYFEQFQRPSLFTHLWSLSVEEQFYLFWPLVFAAGMKLFGRGRLLLGVLAGALASVALAWILFDPGHDASRVYYGTDTHAVGLLAGVALALVWSPIELRRHSVGPMVGPILDAVGVVALGFLVLSFVHVHDYDLALWHGGYLWLALVTALLLAVLAHPASRLGGILGQAAGALARAAQLQLLPLALAGPGADPARRRHRPAARDPDPAAADRLLLLADLSYRFVELPFSGKAKLPRVSERWLRVARPALILGVLAVILVVGWSGIVKAGGPSPEEAAASIKTSAHVSAKLPEARTRTGYPQGRQTRAGKPTPARKPAKRASRSARHSKHWPRIVMLGDSVMIGAEDNLAARLGPGFSMDAKVGRQADEFVAIIEKIKQGGHHPQAMVIQWGNNGPLYSEDMAALRKATTNVGQLFLISDHAPVSWQKESNEAIAEASELWHHTTEIPWAKAAEEGGESLFWDGIHLTPKGAGVYARLVSKVVHEKVAFPR